MRYNTLLIKHCSCCHDFFTHRLQAGVHYMVRADPCLRVQNNPSDLGWPHSCHLVGGGQVCAGVVGCKPRRMCAMLRRQ